MSGLSAEGLYPWWCRKGMIYQVSLHRMENGLPPLPFLLINPDGFHGLWLWILFFDAAHKYREPPWHVSYACCHSFPVSSHYSQIYIQIYIQNHRSCWSHGNEGPYVYMRIYIHIYVVFFLIVPTSTLLLKQTDPPALFSPIEIKSKKLILNHFTVFPDGVLITD